MLGFVFSHREVYFNNCYDGCLLKMRHKDIFPCLVFLIEKGVVHTCITIFFVTSSRFRCRILRRVYVKPKWAGAKMNTKHMIGYIY